eukprot:scaffold65403_cov37-Tisochrysis_lutea.AAC.1
MTPVARGTHRTARSGVGRDGCARATNMVRACGGAALKGCKAYLPQIFAVIGEEEERFGHLLATRIPVRLALLKHRLVVVRRLVSGRQGGRIGLAPTGVTSVVHLLAVASIEIEPRELGKGDALTVVVGLGPPVAHDCFLPAVGAAYCEAAVGRATGRTAQHNAAQQAHLLALELLVAACHGAPHACVIRPERGRLAVVEECIEGHREDLVRLTQAVPRAVVFGVDLHLGQHPGAQTTSVSGGQGEDGRARRWACTYRVTIGVNGGGLSTPGGRMSRAEGRAGSRAPPSRARPATRRWEARWLWLRVQAVASACACTHLKREVVANDAARLWPVLVDLDTLVRERRQLPLLLLDIEDVGEGAPVGSVRLAPRGSRGKSRARAGVAVAARGAGCASRGPGRGHARVPLEERLEALLRLLEVAQVVPTGECRAAWRSGGRSYAAGPREIGRARARVAGEPRRALAWRWPPGTARSSSAASVEATPRRAPSHARCPAGSIRAVSAGAWRAQRAPMRTEGVERTWLSSARCAQKKSTIQCCGSESSTACSAVGWSAASAVHAAHRHGLSATAASSARVASAGRQSSRSTNPCRYCPYPSSSPASAAAESSPSSLPSSPLLERLRLIALLPAPSSACSSDLRFSPAR